MTAFWHRQPNTPVAQLWRRCDICRWSGPNSRFDLYANDRGEYASVCDHAWCRNFEVAEQLRELGWRLIPDPEAK